MKKKFVKAVVLFLLLANLTACAGLNPGMKADAPPIRVGSTEQEVLDRLGYPEDYTSTAYSECWHYGLTYWWQPRATICFRNGKVVNWVN